MNRTERNGAERNGAERSGTERSGAERNGYAMSLTYGNLTLCDVVRAAFCHCYSSRRTPSDACISATSVTSSDVSYFWLHINLFRSSGRVVLLFLLLFCYCCCVVYILLVHYVCGIFRSE